MIGSLPRTERRRIAGDLFAHARHAMRDARMFADHARAATPGDAYACYRWLRVLFALDRAIEARASAKRVRTGGSVLAPVPDALPWRRCVGPNRRRRMGGYEEEP